MSPRFLVVLLAVLGTLPSVTASETARPLLLAGTTWEGGTLLTWVPSQEVGATYNVYMGEDLDSLVKIARTAAPVYHVLREGSGIVYFAVTAVVDGIESKPIVLRQSNEGQYSCVTMSMNGSVGVKPEECVP